MQEHQLLPAKTEHTTTVLKTSNHDIEDIIMPFSKKTVLVTGGSKGIGRAIALAFAEYGAHVAVSARNLPHLFETAKDIESKGGRALAIQCDVTDKAQVYKMAQDLLNQFGALDILVNNAGIAYSQKFLDHPDEMWFKIMDVNLHGVYHVCKAFLPSMVENKKGRVINIASIASKIGARYMTAYTASKHALLGLTRSLALEMVDHNITVNAVCPGYVDTPMTLSSIENITARTGLKAAEAQRILENTSPQKRLIQPEEVAAAVLFLAGETTQGITGQALNIDGGTVLS
jgi:3-hydroxybutyrate dehydrogenase